MNDRDLILNYRLDEVLLRRLDPSEVRVLPLITVIHTVIAVGIGVYSRSSVIVAPLLVELPNICCLYFFNIHVLLHPRNFLLSLARAVVSVNVIHNGLKAFRFLVGFLLRTVFS